MKLLPCQAEFLLSRTPNFKGDEECVTYHASTCDKGVLCRFVKEYENLDEEKITRLDERALKSIIQPFCIYCDRFKRDIKTKELLKMSNVSTEKVSAIEILFKKIDELNTKIKQASSTAEKISFAEDMESVIKIIRDIGALKHGSCNIDYYL